MLLVHRMIFITQENKLMASSVQHRNAAICVNARWILVIDQLFLSLSLLLFFFAFLPSPPTQKL